jgi:hypothetical protein
MPPLSLYARARTYFSIAHETAGAACTRHSLHPLIFEGDMKHNAFMKICSGGRLRSFSDFLSLSVAGRQFGWS